MKFIQKGFSVIEILIVVVVVGLLGVVGWLVYDRQHNKTNVTTSLPSKQNHYAKDGAATTKNPPVEASATSKTVTGPEGWTIDIPDNWLTLNCNSADGTTYVAGVASSKDRIGICNSDAIPEAHFGATQNLDALKSPPTKSDDDQIFTDEKVTINGVEGHKYTAVKSSDSMYAGFTYIDYVLPHNNRVYMAHYTQNESGPNDQATFDKIVQSWKF